jgi:hypothetical protein
MRMMDGSGKLECTRIGVLSWLKMSMGTARCTESEGGVDKRKDERSRAWLVVVVVMMT